MNKLWCETQKHIYESHDAAVVAAGDSMEPYLCRLCLRWHIGHSAKQRRQARRQALHQMVRSAEAQGLYDQPEVAL